MLTCIGLQETAELIRGGWAHTGDKGYYDEKEHIFVIGRYKELIKYRNLHVRTMFLLLIDEINQKKVQ